MKTFFFSLLVLCFSPSLFAGTVTAVTNSGSPGDWTNGTTWSGGEVPQSGDNVVIPAGKAVLVGSQVYAGTPLLYIEVSGTLDFEPSGKLTLSLLSYLRIILGGKIVPKNSASSQLIVIGGIIKYNAANNGTVSGPAVADALSGVSVPGLPKSGFTPWVLPVTLTTFTATPAESGFVLHWQTADEKDLDHFIVERSSDGGTNYSATGSLAAKGSGSAYSFTDYFTANGQVLYRLKMVEKTGRVSYSGVFSISKVASANITLWPNPASSLVSIAFPRPLRGNVKLRVHGTAGELVRTAVFDGTQSFIQFSVAGLAKGNYLLVVEKDGALLTRQLVAVQ